MNKIFYVSLLSITVVICSSCISRKTSQDSKMNDNIKFSDLNNAVENLRKDESAKKDSIRNIESLVTTWDESGIRSAALRLIQQECIAEATKPVLLLEWGNNGGGPYNAILLTPKFVLCLNDDTKLKVNVQIEKKVPITPEFFAQLQKMVDETISQSGDASIFGCDIATYFFTFWEGNKVANTIGIYGLSRTVDAIYFGRQPTIKNKDFYDATYKIATLFLTLLKEKDDTLK